MIKTWFLKIYFFSLYVFANKLHIMFLLHLVGSVDFNSYTFSQNVLFSCTEPYISTSVALTLYSVFLFYRGICLYAIYMLLCNLLFKKIIVYSFIIFFKSGCWQYFLMEWRKEIPFIKTFDSNMSTKWSKNFDCGLIQCSDFWKCYLIR